jgi:uncharacterized protein (DUF2062 family)
MTRIIEALQASAIYLLVEDLTVVIQQDVTLSKITLECPNPCLWVQLSSHACAFGFNAFICSMFFSYFTTVALLAITHNWFLSASPLKCT